MWILIARVLGIALGAWFLKELFGSDSEELDITEESNSDNEFKRFNQAIEIDSEKVNKLRRAHNTIRDKIKRYFQERTNYPIPSFFIQGSYKTKTLIQNVEPKCDIDLGLYFPYEPHAQIERIQHHIKEALRDHTTRGVIIKTNCVRLNYVSDFHIDIPVYFTDQETGQTYFGSRGYEWEPSEPKEFIEWFKETTKGKPQLVRIIRYYKAWIEFLKFKKHRKLPSGLALTIWVLEFYEEAQRDDIAFFQTGIKILKYLDDTSQNNWSADMPVEPYDNVLDRLEKSQQEYFYDQMKDMLKTAAESLGQESKNSALRKWRKIFGGNF